MERITKKAHIKGDRSIIKIPIFAEKELKERFEIIINPKNERKTPIDFLKFIFSFKKTNDKIATKITIRFEIIAALFELINF